MSGRLKVTAGTVTTPLGMRALSIVTVAILGAGPLVSEAETATGSILDVAYGYGNLETDIPIEKLAISIGSAFSFSCRDKSHSARLVTWYSDVPEGDWLGLENQSGNLQLAINNGDADVLSGCGKGDQIELSFE